MCTAPEGYLALCVAPEGGATLGVENNVVHLVQCSDNIPLKHGHCRLVLTCDIGQKNKKGNVVFPLGCFYRVFGVALH